MVYKVFEGNLNVFKAFKGILLVCSTGIQPNKPSPWC